MNEAAPAHGPRQRILVVEDNAVTRKLVRHILESGGYEVIEAVSGAEALELAKSRNPALVLLDLLLPDVSGFDLLAPLRGVLRPHVPVLAFTGLMSVMNEERLRRTDFDAVVYKPAAPAQLRETVRSYLAQPAEPSEAFGKGLRLLIADDDNAQRKLVAFRLSRLGFEVTSAADGVEALGLARSHPPDVVVSDLLMPHMDGYQLCAELRADQALPRMPVILLTNSYVEDSDRALAARVGADDYIVRTPDLRNLVASLRGILSGAATRGRPVDTQAVAEVQSEHSTRTARQLDRQLELNAGLHQRASLLAAELTILGGLTRALATRRDPEAALDDALSVCFDAGGISWGIVLTKDQTGWACRKVGMSQKAQRHLPAHAASLADALGVTHDVGSSFTIDLAEKVSPSLTGLALVTPIVLQDEVVGALVIYLGDRQEAELAQFADVVASQLALVVELSRNFTELENASRSERERAEILASIVDAVGQPLIVLGPDGTPTLSNPAAEQLELFRAHVSADDSAKLGMYRSDQTTLYKRDELPTTRALRGEPVTDEEVMLRESSGDPRWMSITARPVRGPEDSIRGAVAVIRDVTDEKRAQERQINSDRLASIGTLAASVAHEINNPLTSVLAELEMALEDLPSEHPAAERLRAAMDAAARVRTIVKDLRTVSRKETSSLRNVDLRRVLDTAVRMAAPQIRRCATLLQEYEPVAAISASEPRLVQVFLNLLVNAAQAIGPGAPGQRHIRVRLRPASDGGAIAEVSDDGPGMTPDVRARLFTPFFTTKPAGEGTGLGLSISQKIVSSVGGVLECDSALGVGTTFRARFPPTQEPAESAAPMADVAAPNAVPLRILVVEEDPLSYQIACRALQPQYELVLATSTAEALLHLESDAAIDVILCDLETKRPHRDEFYEQLRARYPERLPPILLMGKARPGDSTDRPRLDKPFAAPRLREFVDQQVQLLVQRA